MPTVPATEPTADVPFVFAGADQVTVLSEIPWPEGATKVQVLARSADTTFAFKSASDSADGSTRSAPLNQTVSYGPVKETAYAGLEIRAFGAGTVIVSLDIVDES